MVALTQQLDRITIYFNESWRKHALFFKSYSIKFNIQQPTELTFVIHDLERKPFNSIQLGRVLFLERVLQVLYAVVSSLFEHVYFLKFTVNSVDVRGAHERILMDDRMEGILDEPDPTNAFGDPHEKYFLDK